MMNSPRAQRYAYEAFLQECDPDMMLTFTFQRRVSFEHMQKAVHLFMNKTQAAVLGRRWSRHPIETRPTLIGMAEHQDRTRYQNPHIHAALFAPEAFVKYLRTSKSQELWRHSGQHCGVLDAGRTRNTVQMVRYMFKEAYRPDWQDGMVIYTPSCPNGELGKC